MKFNVLVIYFQSLIEIFDQIAAKKYSHFCAIRIIEYGSPETRSKAINAVFGHVIKLVTNQNGSALIDTIYISWASAQQKAYMRQEFYGDLYKKVRFCFIACFHRCFNLFRFTFSVQRLVGKTRFRHIQRFTPHEIGCIECSEKPFKSHCKQEICRQ